MTVLRYKLRSLLILLDVFPPLLAGGWWLWTTPDWTKLEHARRIVRPAEQNLSAVRRSYQSRHSTLGEEWNPELGALRDAQAQYADADRDARHASLFYQLMRPIRPAAPSRGSTY